MPVWGNQTDRIKNVRFLASNLSDSDVSNTDLVKDILTSDNLVKTKTKKFDWSEADPQWLSMILASDLFCSAQELEGFAGKTYEQKIIEQRKEANSIINSYLGIDDTSGGGAGSTGSTKTDPQYAVPNINDHLDPTYYMPQEY